MYGTVRLEAQMGGLALTVDIAPHRRNRPRCAGCEQPGGVYDRLAPRRFEFVRSGACACSFCTPCGASRVRAVV